MPPFSQNDNSPSITRWLLAKGIAKTPEGAHKIMVGVVVVMIFLTLLLVRKSFFGGSGLTPAGIRDYEERTRNLPSIQHENTTF